MTTHQNAKEKAVKVLRKATTPAGILALATDEVTENYTRVWARDSIMAGYAGILAEDDLVIEGMKSSLDTLQQHQSILGIIPSNVATTAPTKVSYGGTAGRVDATLWYIVGVLLYYQATDDHEFISRHRQSLLLAIKVGEYWEFNHKHLIYTPLSGNWADEYPLHGYTLYDNCLRLWGLQLYGKLMSTNLDHKANEVQQAIVSNFFFPSESLGPVYHPSLYAKTTEELVDSPFPLAAFNPARYYDIFDCGGVGLALMLGLFSTNQSKKLYAYLRTLMNDIGQDLIPAFWPVIKPEDKLWDDVEMNYAYEFKNKPHHFHNGGVWPIMMGWLSRGAVLAGHTALADDLLEGYLAVCRSENYAFSEYISSDTILPGGKSPLCYSAAGLILMMTR